MPQFTISTQNSYSASAKCTLWQALHQKLIGSWFKLPSRAAMRNLSGHWLFWEWNMTANSSPEKLSLKQMFLWHKTGFMTLLCFPSQTTAMQAIQEPTENSPARQAWQYTHLPPSLWALVTILALVARGNFLRWLEECVWLQGKIRHVP